MRKIKNNGSAFTPLEMTRPNARRLHRGGLSLTGFTLIELLVTGSIMAMIALAVFSTFSMGVKAYKRMQYSGLTQADVLLSLEKIEKDLHNTLNFSGINFAGENRKVSFAGLVGPAADSESLSLGRISYYFDAKNNSLLKEESAYSQSFSDSKVLASIEDVVFTYCYFNTETQKYDWKDSGSVIPTAVKIKVIFKNENDKDVETTRTVVIPVSG